MFGRIEIRSEGISLEDIIRRHRAVEIKIVENSVDLPGAAEVIVANPEVERQRGCDLPVVREEETVVVESVSPDGFTVVEGDIIELAGAVLVLRYKPSHSQEPSPTPPVSVEAEFAVLGFLQVAVELVAAMLTAELDGVLTPGERQRVTESVRFLDIEDLSVLRSKLEFVAHVKRPTNADHSQVGPLRGQRVVNAELGVGKVRPGLRVVPVAEENRPKFVDDGRAENVDVGD